VEEQRKYHLEKIVSIGLMGLAIFLWFYFIPTFAPGSQEGLVPRIGAGILFVSSLAHFFILSFGKVKKKVSLALNEIPIVLIGVHGAFIFLLETIGFFVSAFFMLGTLMLYLGVKRQHLLVIPIFLLFIYLVFDYGLNIRLPRGFLF